MRPDWPPDHSLSAGVASHQDVRKRQYGKAPDRQFAGPKERNLTMSVPRTVVDDATRNALLGLAIGDVDVLQEAVDIREAEQQSSGLDPVTFGLVKVAALIALDSPPASYLWQIANALDAGATPADILGVLRAVAPQVGGPKIISAAPEIMVALGLSLPAGQESVM
jgi:4-carboxymuconolactone decarboxylase